LQSVRPNDDPKDAGKRLAEHLTAVRCDKGVEASMERTRYGLRVTIPVPYATALVQTT
jgi:hypothetical protein